MADEENPLQTDADLNELMKRDPLSLTDDDVDKIASRLRQARHTFQQQELKKSKSGGKKSSGGGSQQKKDPSGVDLDNLNLDLNL